MATFYILPARPLLAQHLATHLLPLLPGLNWAELPAAELADWLAGLAERQPDVYVVQREDLPEGVPVLDAVRDGYGAEPGDALIEVDLGQPPQWTIAPRRAA